MNHCLRKFKFSGSTKLFVRIGLCLLLLATPLSLSASSDHSHHSDQWAVLVKELGQSGKKSEEAKIRLRRLPNLVPTLLAALETRDRLLALEVISSLRLREVIPALLKRVPSDRDGFLILTLNSLLHGKRQKEILETYLENVRSWKTKNASPAAVVAMLEPLGRLGWKVSDETLLSLLRHDFQEVQAAVLIYLREQAFHFGRTKQLKLIPTLGDSSADQVRLQAAFLLEELQKKSQKENSPFDAGILNWCKKDRNPEVRGLCVKLQEEGSRKG